MTEENQNPLNKAEDPTAAPVSADASGEAVPVTFQDLGLSDEAIALCEKAGYVKPTPIQREAIPFVLEGQDVLGSAQTGTGKTATFTLPIVDKLAGRGGTLAIVLAPTREIAQQTLESFETFGKPRGVKAACLIGGVDMKPQLEALREYPQVIIATPGRLFDHIERGTVWLEYVEMVVLDEADRMLDMGFIPQITRILEEVTNPDRQILLFSATIPPAIEKLTERFMRDPVRVRIGKPLAAATTVEHVLWYVDSGQKRSELRQLLRDESGTIFVFCRSKKGAVEIWQSLHSDGIYDATMLHSDRTQEQRLQAVADFKSGKYRILVATDVAARGLDVPNVGVVINYDVPLIPEDYVHRIGRSGRAETKGRAITLATREDSRLIADIEKMLKMRIPVARGTGPTHGGRSQGEGERSSGGGGQRHGRPAGRHGPQGRGGRGGGRSGQRDRGDRTNTSPVKPPVVLPKPKSE